MQILIHGAQSKSELMAMIERAIDSLGVDQGLVLSGANLQFHIIDPKQDKVVHPTCDEGFEIERIELQVAGYKPTKYESTPDALDTSFDEQPDFMIELDDDDFCQN